ncbi:hypothetical protein GCM10009745_80300 [Kribbella yunnanensis]|uniref:PE-PGRS family protein n=1 Tax=Kribbella yunnanensis TaxID=190194 RepID=A0ABP4V784_9ACTN
MLQWVVDGCPDGVYEDGFQHRIVARALERRGLITIKGRGKTWTAKPHPADQAGAAPRQKADKQDVSSNASPPRRAPKPIGAKAPSQLSEAEQLVTQVLAAGGRLPLELKPGDLDRYHRLVASSLHAPNRPRGKRLEVKSVGQWPSGQWEVRLTEHFADLVESIPVPMPDRVAKYHPAVAAFRQDKDWHYVSAEQLPRAARILQALVAEAPKRSVQVEIPPPADSRSQSYAGQRKGRWHLMFRTAIGEFTLRIKEQPGKGGKQVARRYWNEPKVKPAWIEARNTEFVPTGNLELVVDGPGMPYKGTSFRDAKTINLEDRLPEVFRTLEIRRHEHEWREQERKKSEAERQSRWQAAIAKARIEYDHDARRRHFDQAEREWQRINRQRAFLIQAKSVSVTIDPLLRPALEAQLELIRKSLDAADPLNHPELLIPDVPEPQPDDLIPYLGGWSPHGPNHHRP